MFEKARLFVYRAITGLHCGAGEGESGLDLPVMRERFTGLPFIPGSSLKGVWRDYCDHHKKWEPQDTSPSGGDERPPSPVEIAFGPGPEKGESDQRRAYAGCLGFNDARLMFLPVRASRGTFAMLTSPYQIEKYLEARSLAGLTPPAKGKPDFASSNNLEIYFPALTGEEASVLQGLEGKKIYLEDLELTLCKDPSQGSFFSGGYFDFLPLRLRKRLALVSDDVFQWFARNCLQVAPHNVLKKEEKVSYNFWYEEVVPVESIFYQLILSSRPRVGGETGKDSEDADKYLKILSQTKVSFFQVGGHETTGRGLLEVTPLGQEGA